jgi:predicted outer membrane protein
MKKSLIATLIAVPMLSLAPLASAAEPAPTEPMLLSATEMDSVTAGFFEYNAGIFQVNISPVTVVQVNVLNFGDVANIADIISGNLGGIGQ